MPKTQSRKMISHSLKKYNLLVPFKHRVQ